MSPRREDEDEKRRGPFSVPSAFLGLKNIDSNNLTMEMTMENIESTLSADQGHITSRRVSVMIIGASFDPGIC
jgi:hypothetical protein